jgi:hypothetical protein
MNTAFVYVLIQGNLRVVTGGRSGTVSRVLDSTSMLSGGLADVTSDW